MTKAELIERLKRVPDDAEVVIYSRSGAYRAIPAWATVLLRPKRAMYDYCHKIGIIFDFEAHISLKHLLKHNENQD